MRVLENIWVPMDDGVEIAAAVYLPKAEGALSSPACCSIKVRLRRDPREPLAACGVMASNDATDR